VHLDAGRLREALPDLELAFKLSRDVSLLGDLGLALKAAGRLDEAWLALYRFRAEARVHHEPVRARIDAALGELEAKLGGLLVEADAPDAEVLVRGQVTAKLPLVTPIFLAPGDVAVVIRAPGKVATTIRGVPTAAVAAPVASVWPLVLGIGGGVVMTGAIISSIVAANLRASFNAALCGGSGASLSVHPSSRGSTSRRACRSGAISWAPWQSRRASWSSR
jgi:hypothetical protein